MSVLYLKYRLYPSKSQRAQISVMFETCRQIYNSMLLWRKHAWETEQESIDRSEQKAILPVWKEKTDEAGHLLYPELRQVNAQALQQVVDRVDLALRAFFRRVKAGETPGYPRFKGEGQYESLTYIQNTAFSVGENYVGFSKIGRIKAVIHRTLIGTPKQCVLRKQGDEWYACVSVEVEEQPLPENSQAVALDMGLEKFAVLSNAVFGFARQRPKCRNEYIGVGNATPRCKSVNALLLVSREHSL